MKAEDLFIQKFQQLVEDVPVGITIFRGPEFIVEMANENYLQIIDKSKTEFIGKPLFEALPEVRKNVEPLLNDAYWKGIPFNGTEFEVPLTRHGHTETAWFNFVYQPLREENVITGIIVVASDVTEQVRRKLLLQQTEERARLATEASLAGVFDIGVPSYNINCSRRFYEIFDLPFSAPMEEILNRIHPEDRAIRTEAWAAGEHSGILHYDIRVITGQGEIRWIRTQGRMYKNGQGELIRVLGTILDITEQKTFSEALENKVKERTIELQRANEELALRNQELMSFNYISSHDLQEPLRKIQTFASRIQGTETQLSPQNQTYLQRMQRSAAQMQLLIRDLLEYSRAGQNERTFEKTNLGEALQLIRQQLFEEINAGDIRVEIGDLPTVDAIPFQINQLFTNLLSNAIKFSRRSEHPLIRIDAARENGYHVIRVRDNGIGFPPEQKEQIFEVFRRLHHRSDYEGTGIGLAICKKIVENHHGRISAESTPGKGATFAVFLPA
jgi:PAS domain S-box-containing protein